MPYAPDVDSLITELKLARHPEGGWYCEIHRSATTVQTLRGARAALTTIYYLLAAGQLSRWHVVDSDEIWHFYHGEPLELLTYDPASREFNRHVLNTTTAGQQVAVVPAGIWQAARPLGKFTLVGCSVGPGFVFEDFRFVSALAEHSTHFGGVLNAYRELL
jgi:predicted cupin superfamily sugar epimerase